MENSEGVAELEYSPLNYNPIYLVKERNFFENRRVLGYMRCLDCEGSIPLDQSDSYMCRKVNQTVLRLESKGWSSGDIVKECKRIYGNDIIYRHFGDPERPLFVKNM